MVDVRKQTRIITNAASPSGVRRSMGYWLRQNNEVALADQYEEVHDTSSRNSLVIHLQELDRAKLIALALLSWLSGQTDAQAGEITWLQLAGGDDVLVADAARVTYLKMEYAAMRANLAVGTPHAILAMLRMYDGQTINDLCLVNRIAIDGSTPQAAYVSIVRALVQERSRSH